MKKGILILKEWYEDLIDNKYVSEEDMKDIIYGWVCYALEGKDVKDFNFNPDDKDKKFVKEVAVTYKYGQIDNQAEAENKFGDLVITDGYNRSMYESMRKEYFQLKAALKGVYDDI